MTRVTPNNANYPKHLSLGGNFGPEKKYLAPRPNSPQTPSRPLPPPRPHPPGTPPPPGIFHEESSPLPLPAPWAPLSPPPSRKKFKKTETSTNFKGIFSLRVIFNFLSHSTMEDHASQLQERTLLEREEEVARGLKPAWPHRQRASDSWPWLGSDPTQRPWSEVIFKVLENTLW